MSRLLILILTLLLLTPPLASQGQTVPLEISGSRKAVRTSTDIALMAMPAATLTIALCKQDWKGIAIGAAECGGTLALTYGLKYLVKKKRPDNSDRHSFPSGHTSLAFVDASFLMRRYGWKFGVPAYAVAGYIAWGRTYAKKHDFWDVAAGAAIGSAIGLLATTPFVKKHDLKLIPALIETPAPDGSNTFINFGIGGSLTF